MERKVRDDRWNVKIIQKSGQKTPDNIPIIPYLTPFVNILKRHNDGNLPYAQFLGVYFIQNYVLQKEKMYGTI